MKTRILIAAAPLLLCFLWVDVFAQTGLNKSKDEIISFISRPAYTAVYSKVVTGDKMITSLSTDSTRRIQYYLNSFDRCNREVMGEKIELNDRDSKLAFLLEYLKALNFKSNLDADNKFINRDERMIALIEEKNGWVNIEFKKF